jgi:molybdenum cofactor guanylyltransferase
MDNIRKFGSAVILCGGKSLRMGFDKSKITIEGKPIYEFIAKKLEAVFEDIILVTNKRNRIINSKYRVVEDIIKECGPMGGIYTGLKYAASEYVFFTACDMPFVDISLIEYIKDILNKKVFNGAVAINSGHIEPLYSFYSKGLETSLKYNIDQGNYQMNKLVRNANFYMIEESYWNKDGKPSIYSNLNYLEDLNILKDIYGDEVAFDE